MDLPSLTSLAALEALARLGSVTRAAQALHLTQGAISHRLHALQRETGLTLLEHVGRGVRLTPAGLRLARASADARSMLEDTLTSLVREPLRAVLSISCSPSFAIRFLVPRLQAFRASHPELDLRIAADEVSLHPLRAAADVSVRLLARPEPGLYAEKLIDEIAFPIASPHLLARTPLTTCADLARHTLLHDEAFAHVPERIGWSAFLRHFGETHVDIQRGVRFSHAYLAIQAALAGDGVALVRRTLVAEELRRGHLVAPLSLQMPSALTYYWLSESDPARKPALGALREFLVHSLRDAERTANRALRPRATGPTAEPKNRPRRKRG